jgi:hypothetical protein
MRLSQPSMPVAVVAHLAHWALVHQLAVGRCPGAVHLRSTPVQVQQQHPLMLKSMSQWVSEWNPSCQRLRAVIDSTSARLLDWLLLEGCYLV